MGEVGERGVSGISSLIEARGVGRPLVLPLANVASNDDLGVPPESCRELWERKCATEDLGMLSALVRIGGGPAME